MKKFSIKNLVLGTVQTNTYIMSNTVAKEAIVFDPADDSEAIEEYLKANDLVCKAILLTHGHFDHIIAARELSKHTQAPIYAHEDEVKLLEDPDMNASALFGERCSLTPDLFVKDQEILNLAGFSFQVLHTPGHTLGGVCYYCSEHEVLMSGDTLFRESIGRTDLPTGNGRVLIHSIKEKLMKLEDQVVVYPGHGMPTTIGYERKHNYYILHN